MEILQRSREFRIIDTRIFPLVLGTEVNNVPNVVAV